MEVVVLSGGFDPVHDGHIEMFKAAALKYDYVIVGLNSDEWLKRKKAQVFMGFGVRKSILDAISFIDEVVSFDDSDNTCKNLLENISALHANVTFGNGGDRSDGNFPEFDFCKSHNIKIDDTLGGSSKLNSSSQMLARWRWPGEKRSWGEWKVLNSYQLSTKVKELIVLPNERLSWQKHDKRSELWFIRDGIGTLYHSQYENKDVYKTKLVQNQTFTIPVGTWHQLANETDNILSVIEIQYGELCQEYDITRSTRPLTKDELYDNVLNPN